jgi:hypothetical protein
MVKGEHATPPQQHRHLTLAAVPPQLLPQPAPPLSKRDKRRNLLAEKLADLTSTFSQNCDGFFRHQLQALQADMNMIMRANPYLPFPLDDLGDSIAEAVSATLTGAAGGSGAAAAAPAPPPPFAGGVSSSAPPAAAGASSGVGIPISQRRPEVDGTGVPGKYYSEFTDAVNTAMEERDAALTLLLVRVLRASSAPFLLFPSHPCLFHRIAHAHPLVRVVDCHSPSACLIFSLALLFS